MLPTRKKLIHYLSILVNSCLKKFVSFSFIEFARPGMWFESRPHNTVLAVFCTYRDVCSIPTPNLTRAPQGYIPSDGCYRVAMVLLLHEPLTQPNSDNDLTDCWPVSNLGMWNFIKVTHYQWVLLALVVHYLLDLYV